MESLPYQQEIPWQQGWLASELESTGLHSLMWRLHACMAVLSFVLLLVFMGSRDSC